MRGLTTIKQNYVTSALPGQWPDWQAPGWQLTYDGKDLAATFARYPHHPFGLPDTAAPAGVATATITARAARVPLATGAPSSAPGALPITVCGARPEAPAITLHPFGVVTAASGNVWARQQEPEERCAKKDGLGTVAGWVKPMQRQPVMLQQGVRGVALALPTQNDGWGCLAAQAALVGVAAFLLLRAWGKRPYALVSPFLSPAIVVREATPVPSSPSSNAAMRDAKQPV